MPSGGTNDRTSKQGREPRIKPHLGITDSDTSPEHPRVEIHGSGPRPAPPRADNGGKPPGPKPMVVQEPEKPSLSENEA